MPLNTLLRFSGASAFSVCSAVKFKDLAISLEKSAVPGKIKSTLDLIIKNSFIELRMMLKKMKISSLLKGGIYEVSFGYHSKLEGYTTLMSDIPTLAEIAPPDKMNDHE